ncbi:MAG: hypothetical protein QOD99_3118 [Chthoniobacter sp.]|nr:hypothetical protein [Chthoniobacter sp.]
MIVAGNEVTTEENASLVAVSFLVQIDFVMREWNTVMRRIAYPANSWDDPNMPINWDQYGERINVGVDDDEELSEPGIIYTEGLGPCIGACIAYGTWARIVHSSTVELDGEEYETLIAAAKNLIPANRVSSIRPVLCGNDPAADATCEASRAWAIKKLKDAGFADPILHWCAQGQTAELRVCLTDKLIEVEVGYKTFEYPVTQD